MKTLIILSYIFVISKVFASDSSACSSGDEKNLNRCFRAVTSALKSAGSAPTTCSAHNGGDAQCYPLASRFSNSGANCESFISRNPNQGFGPWGREVIAYLNEKGENSIFFRNNLPGMDSGTMACPNWKNLSLEDKKHFWVWTIAAIAKVESTCLPGARNVNGTNGVAAGLLQLEERASMRSWRGSNCGVANVMAPRANIRCGLDILSELLKGRAGLYRSSGELWGSRANSYWEHLRHRDGGEIAALIKLHPACRVLRSR